MKKLVSVLIVAAIIVTFCSCGRDSLNSVSDTGSKVVASSSHQNDVKPPLDPKTVKPDPYQIKPETAVQTQFVQQNEAFSLKGLAYQIQSISVSKKLNRFSKKKY